MAETKTEKAHRYLTEGRVTVVTRDHDFIHAYVRGDSGELHSCGHDQGRDEWRCTCDAWTKRASHPDCSHLVALKLVAPIGARAEAIAT